ncbi:MAG: hypothetical protein HY904_10255 [Deltaproteobacteria bacterium]|nr:hypothetical protein [Deltaproteobacteria bacterium]
MTEHGIAGRLGGVLAAGVAAAALVSSGAGAEAHGKCHAVEGHFDLIPVGGPECTSPIGVCGRGTFRGGIRGDYFSLLQTITFTDETPITGVVLITGDTVLGARAGERRGDLFFKDSGAFHTAGDGEFAEIFTITGGTEDFAGASGSLLTTGTYDFAAGGVGEYHGRVCHQ